ncbi:GNAT family N-acetyltransferase [Azospirillum sp. sgz301742]
MLQTALPTVPPHLAARGVSLRPREDSDAEFLRDVYIAYRWEEVAATGWPEDMRLAFLHDQYRMQDAHYTKHYDGAAWGVVEVDGARAGRLYLLNCGSDLRIVDIAFLPPYRNMGLGGGLLAAVQEQARALGVAKASIHVEQSNPALRLYERLGFQKVELRGIYHLLEWPAS